MSAIAKKPPKSPSGMYCGGDNADSIPNNYFGYGRIDVLAAVNVCRANCRSPKKQDNMMILSGTGDTTMVGSSSSAISFSTTKKSMLDSSFFSS